MKSVLISIQPKWCELIASGKKTVEVRKTRPKIDTPFKCYIYCTNTKPYLAWGDSFRGGSWITDFSALRGYNKKDAERIFELFNGKVIGEFVCDEIKRIHCQSIEKEAICAIAVGNGHKEYYDNSCVSYKEAYRYLRNVKKAYAWHISDLVIYDKPKELSEFVTHCKYEFDDDFEHCEGCQFYCYSNTPSCGIEEYCGCDGLKPITRPPQSWCYVELLKNDKE